MSDHELSLGCGPCEHWDRAPLDPAEWLRQCQDNRAELRRLEAAVVRPVSWWVMQLAFHFDPAYAIDRQPLILNEGTRFETPFTVELALAWAERLAR